jgi:glycerol-3-phosphate dehydrogenase
VRVQRSKGVHVLVSSIDGMRQRDAVFARAPSGGHVIVAPWRDRLLIGPTDTPMAESVDDARATRADVDEVLGTLNATLAPGVAAVGVDDVVDTTVGVRPLIATGRSTYQSSRRHEIHDHADDGCRGLYSILGGKWTTGRATAEDLLQAMHRDGILGRAPLVSTRRLPISTAWAWADDAEPYAAVEAVRWADLGLAADVVDAVLRLYGTRARDVLAIARADPAMGVRVSSRPGVLDIGAQVVWAVLAEGAVTLPDVIDRRLVIGTLGGITRGEVDRVARIAAPLWGQDPTELTAAEWGRRMALRALWSG